MRLQQLVLFGVGSTTPKKFFAISTADFFSSVGVTIEAGVPRAARTAGRDESAPARLYAEHEAKEASRRAAERIEKLVTSWKLEELEDLGELYEIH